MREINNLSFFLMEIFNFLLSVFVNKGVYILYIKYNYNIVEFMFCIEFFY